MSKKTDYKSKMIKDLRSEFPELSLDEVEVILEDLVELPILFKDLITKTQIQLKTNDIQQMDKMTKKYKKIGKAYKLKVSDVVLVQSSIKGLK